MKSVLAVIVLWTAIIPTATGSGAFDAGPVFVVLANGHASECAEDFSGLCPASVSGEAPNDMEVDANQQIAYVGVAVNRTYVNEAAGFQLLPDGSMMFTPSEYAISNPLFDVLVDDVGTQRGPGPLHSFGIYFNDTRFGLYVFAPDPVSGNMTPAERKASWAYVDDGASQGVVHRHEIRPNQDFGDASSDYMEREWTTVLCYSQSDPQCAGAADSIADSYEAATPNVAGGVAFIEAEVATDPTDIGPDSSAIGARDQMRSPLAARSPLLRPQGLNRDPSAKPLVPILPLVGGGPSGPPQPGAPRHTLPGLRIPAVSPMTPMGKPIVPPVAAYSAAFATAVILAALYAKIRDRDALLSGRRAQIFEIVKERGPTPLAELARELGVDPSTLDYHARALARGKFVTIYRVDRKIVIGTPGNSSVNVPRKPCSRDALLDLIKANGGTLPRAELHRLAADIPIRTRNQALRELRAAGVVEALQGTGVTLIRIIQRNNRSAAM
jgi:DNA-binding transcriptional ArsR family regulator